MISIFHFLRRDHQVLEFDWVVIDIIQLEGDGSVDVRGVCHAQMMKVRCVGHVHAWVMKNLFVIVSILVDIEILAWSLDEATNRDQILSVFLNFESCQLGELVTISIIVAIVILFVLVIDMVIVWVFGFIYSHMVLMLYLILFEGFHPHFKIF